jgi:hypothetical protein
VVATPGGVTPNVDMMSLRPSMTGGDQAALDLEAIIRSAEVMRRPLQLSDVRLEDYDAVYLPGGHGPMQDLAFDADVGRLLTAQLASGKPLAIVCHGPAGRSGCWRPRCRTRSASSSAAARSGSRTWWRRPQPDHRAESELGHSAGRSAAERVRITPVSGRLSQHRRREIACVADVSLPAIARE